MPDDEPFMFTGGEFTINFMPSETPAPEFDVKALGGCVECGLIPLGGPVLCEHGVAPAPSHEISFSMEFEDLTLYRKLVGAADDCVIYGHKWTDDDPCIFCGQSWTALFGPEPR
jgi:hypothetical protein